MRSSFFKKENRKSLKNVVDSIFVIVFAIFWGMIASILVYNYIQRKIYPNEYSDFVVEYSQKYELDSALVFSVIKVESGFDKSAVSSAGAKGLMQIMPSTAEYVAKKLEVYEYDLFDEKTNINFGCFYLKYLFDRFCEQDTALCAYNAGEGNVDGWLKDKAYSDDGKKLKKIPFKETDEYINKIHKSYKKYSRMY